MQILIMAIVMHNHFLRNANLMKFIFCTFITINLPRKASFNEFDRTIMLLKGRKIADIDKYCSYQLTQQGMKAWWYYQIGAGL